MSGYPKNVGHLNFAPGTIFKDRSELSKKRVHGPTQAGIWNDGSEYAVSIVVSGGYIDDKDSVSTLLYTGQGGRDPSTGRQVSDQELTRGNKGLFNSMKLKLPVRVTRGYQVDHGPSSGYRYDGLFMVKRAIVEPSIDGPLIWRFELVSH